MACQPASKRSWTRADPNLGAVFHTLDQDASKPPRFTRQTDGCLIRHGSSRHQGFPGHLIRSVGSR